LRWTQAVDPDVLHGGRVYVRHSNLTDGSGTFQNSVDLVTALAGNTTDVVLPSLEGEYILKFQDDQGNFSVGEASIIQDLPDLVDTQVILQDREDLDSPAFQGTKTNTTFSNTASALQLTNPATNQTGEYAFKDILDLGAVFSLDLKRVIRSVGFSANSAVITATYTQSGTTVTITSNSHGLSVGGTIIFDAISGAGVDGTFVIASVATNTFTFTAGSSQTVSSSNCTFQFVSTFEDVIPAGSFIDDYALNGNFDGLAADEANCQIQVATSQTASGSFGAFNNFANGTFKGRRFKFKLILETTNTAQNMNVQQAGYTAEFQSRTEQNYQTVSGTSTLPQDSGTSASGLDVTFGSPFFVGTSNLGGANAFKPSVGITIMGAATGEYFTIKTNANGDFLNAAGAIVTGTGFNISIKDSNNNPVNKKFTFQAVGYGKGV